MREFTALYRYRDNNGLKSTAILLKALNYSQAKKTAKNMEGQDGKQWLIEVVPNNPYFIQPNGVPLVKP